VDILPPFLPYSATASVRRQVPLDPWPQSDLVLFEREITGNDRATPSPWPRRPQTYLIRDWRVVRLFRYGILVNDASRYYRSQDRLGAQTFPISEFGCRKPGFDAEYWLWRTREHCGSKRSGSLSAHRSLPRSHGAVWYCSSDAHFGVNEHGYSRILSGVLETKSNGIAQFIHTVDDKAFDPGIFGKRNPGSLFGAHLIQLSLHDSLLPRHYRELSIHGSPLAESEEGNHASDSERNFFPTISLITASLLLIAGSFYLISYGVNASNRFIRLRAYKKANCFYFGIFFLSLFPLSIGLSTSFYEKKFIQNAIPFNLRTLTAALL
jgi:hypothetical protein